MPSGTHSVRRKLVDQLRAPGTQWVAAGSLVGGLGAYLFQVVGTRSLGEEAYAPIGVLWTIQYLVLAVPLVSMEAYVTRSVARSSADRAAAGRALPRSALLALVGWLGGAAVVLITAAVMFGDALFGDGLEDLGLVVGFSVVSYGLFVILRGHFAGQDRFRAYGWATAGESTFRLVIAVLVLAVVASPRGLAWTLPIGTTVVLVLWVAGVGRGKGAVGVRDGAVVPSGAGAPGEAGVPADGLPPAGPPQATGMFLAATTTANGAAQVLLAGGPLGLVALGAAPAEISIFFVTITAARIPMVFAINGVLSRLLPPLTRLADRGDASGLRKLTMLTAVGTVGAALVSAAAAALIGRQLVAIFFGASFAPDRLVITLIGGAVMLGTGTLFLNQILIGCHAERRLPLPWLLALGAGIVVMLLWDGSASEQVAVGFLAGEVVALGALLAVTLLTVRRISPGAAPPAG
jgi:O-antigen/teichoic acid export membrane protein